MIPNHPEPYLIIPGGEFGTGESSTNLKIFISFFEEGKFMAGPPPPDWGGSVGWSQATFQAGSHCWAWGWGSSNGHLGNVDLIERGHKQLLSVAGVPGEHSTWQ